MYNAITPNATYPIAIRVSLPGNTAAVAWSRQLAGTSPILRWDIYSQIYVQGTPAEIQIPTHRNPTGRRKRPEARVIAQQCSSTTFVSLRFHSNKEKFGAHLKNFTLLYFMFNYLRLKVPK